MGSYDAMSMGVGSDIGIMAALGLAWIEAEAIDGGIWSGVCSRIYIEHRLTASDPMGTAFMLGAAVTPVMPSGHGGIA